MLRDTQWLVWGSCTAASIRLANGGFGPSPPHWLEDFTFLTMSVEKMPWRNWKGLES
jgi:hypothetical protein